MRARQVFGFIAIALSLAIVGGGYTAFSLWREAENAAYMSCLGSVGSQIQNRLDRDLFEPKGYAGQVIPSGNDWRIWSPAEVSSVMSQVTGGDCGKYEKTGTDGWGRQINIAVRRVKSQDSNYHLEIILWSNGPDGTSGTEDDLVVPYGRKVPN